MDGKDTGKVNPVTLELPAGRQRLRLVNPGVEKELAPGEERVVLEKLR